MKKIILVLCFLFASTNIAFAIENCDPSSPSASTDSEYVELNVLANIPGLSCCKNTWTWSTTYKCKAQRWTKQIIEMLWNIIKYFTFIAWLFWVTFIVYNWILYSMWWAEQSLKEESKKRITQTIIWLIILLMSWYILQLIAPWIYK